MLNAPHSENVKLKKKSEDVDTKIKINSYLKKF